MMLTLGFSWDDKSVEQMSRLIREGQSASQIGAALGCSRNAVIGKANRLQMPLANTNRPIGTAVYSRAAHLTDRRHRRAAGLPADPQEFDGLDLLEPAVSEAASKPTRSPKAIAHGLSKSDCRWPMGKVDGDETFCCVEAVPGCSWCPEHRVRVFVPRVVRDQAPVRVMRARA